MSYFSEVYGDPELSAKAKLVLVYLHDRAKQGWQELVRHRHHGQRPEHLPLHHKTSPGRVDPPGPSGETGKIPGEQRVYFELLSNKAIDAHLM